MKRAHLGGGQSREADRISELPDEIIHDILGRLEYPEETPEAIFLLSRRWMQIWVSYPIIQFSCDEDYYYSAKLQSFVAAASRKLSSFQHNCIKALRISSKCSDFIGDMLDLIVNRELEEIVVHGCSNHFYQLFPPHLFNNPSLRILNLAYFDFVNFEYTNLDMRMINLRVLDLCMFVMDEWLLNGIIAGAPLLESLILCPITKISIRRLLICNHPNLKILELGSCHVEELIQIAGTKLLEKMFIVNSALDSCDVNISLPPMSSLKILNICDAGNLTDDAVNNLIANSPSLQSLCLADIGKVKELNIQSHTLQQMQLVVRRDHQMKLHIDAPRLSNARYTTYMHSLVASTHPTNLQEAQPCTFEVRLLCEGRIIIDNFIKLKDFLTKLRQQFKSILLVCWFSNSFYEGVFDRDQIEDGSSVPMIQHVELRFDLPGLQGKDGFMSSLFWSCHPNYLRVNHDKDNREGSSLKYMAEFFINQNCDNDCESGGYKCWHNQLKDMKIVSKKKKGDGDEQLSDISNYVDWPCTNVGLVWLKLIWC